MFDVFWLKKKKKRQIIVSLIMYIFKTRFLEIKFKSVLLFINSYIASKKKRLILVKVDKLRCHTLF